MQKQNNLRFNFKSFEEKKRNVAGFPKFLTYQKAFLRHQKTTQYFQEFKSSPHSNQFIMQI